VQQTRWAKRMMVFKFNQGKFEIIHARLFYNFTRNGCGNFFTQSVFLQKRFVGRTKQTPNNLTIIKLASNFNSNFLLFKEILHLLKKRGHRGSRVWTKIFVFALSRNFRENFVFASRKNLLAFSQNFRKNFTKNWRKILQQW